MVEPAMRNVEEGQIIQIQRKSFFICDRKTETSMVLIEIPDGKDMAATKKMKTSAATNFNVRIYK